MTINPVTERDLDDWLQLALELWSDYVDDDMRAILSAIGQSPKETAFLVRDEQGVAIGFMNLSLRYDYVPGAEHKPVGYVEGIYVREAHQQQGIGRRLLERAEQWTREQGCHELASDALIDNHASAELHARLGFNEAERIHLLYQERIEHHVSRFTY